MRQFSFLMLLSIAFLFSTARADLLPDVSNIQLNGSTLTWDAQDGAAGYNITRNGRYYDTVRNTLSYELDEEGSYSVLSFNDTGDFGSDYNGTRLDFSPTESDASVSYNYQYWALYVYKTCNDVGPGESCIASCPRQYDPGFNRPAYPAYVSGGACTTSDIVEADAFVGPKTYKCTVPTYSGEVVAQAICVFNR